MLYDFGAVWNSTKSNIQPTCDIDADICANDRNCQLSLVHSNFALKKKLSAFIVNFATNCIEIVCIVLWKKFVSQ
ncbi:unnamed protein product [Litomosoides sigmodontis]|uniref:Uncharacterized protein n=1 Tax=Litomosoides sigmodontis TaxID=42156 RepID=A0A3P6U4E4_LITSI|nr:unnamed protein product [Litomosoides sigmodontis]